MRWKVGFIEISRWLLVTPGGSSERNYKKIEKLLLLFADAPSAVPSAGLTIFHKFSFFTFEKFENSRNFTKFTILFFLFFFNFLFLSSFSLFFLLRKSAQTLSHWDIFSQIKSKRSQIVGQCMTLHITVNPLSDLKDFTSNFSTRCTRKTRKLCNLELFFSCVHTPNLFFFYSRTTRYWKSSFHCQPDNANVCCVGAFIPSIHWVRFSSEMKSIGHALCINNKSTRANYHNILFLYQDVHRIPSWCEMGNCVVWAQEYFQCVRRKLRREKNHLCSFLPRTHHLLALGAFYFLLELLISHACLIPTAQFHKVKWRRKQFSCCVRTLCVHISVMPRELSSFSLFLSRWRFPQHFSSCDSLCSRCWYLFSRQFCLFCLPISTIYTENSYFRHSGQANYH